MLKNVKKTQKITKIVILKALQPDYCSLDLALYKLCNGIEFQESSIQHHNSQSLAVSFHQVSDWFRIAVFRAKNGILGGGLTF
jgi:hypothetical protein